MTTVNLQELKHHNQLQSKVIELGELFHNPTEQVVFSVLISYFNTRTQVAFPSNKTISKKANICVRQVQYTINNLCQKGWIIKQARFEGKAGDKNRRQTTNAYFINLEKFGFYINKQAKKMMKHYSSKLKAWQQEKAERDAKAKAQHEHRQTQGQSFDALYDSMKANAVSTEDGLSYVDNIKSKLFGKKPK